MTVPGGYIILARKIIDSELMNRPPLHLKLWVWMLGKANWRDRDKLKRGQFVTTIAEMQEAMSYRIGYRKSTPTKDEIRNAYEAFTKATMITTTKTARGMIITILNYDTYQNSENYEAHNEAHDENAMKPTVTPHDTEEREKRRKKFSPPTLYEVRAYCLERGNGIDPEAWHNHYVAKGWMIGKGPMKDWKAAVRTWEKSATSPPAPVQSGGHPTWY